MSIQRVPSVPFTQIANSALRDRRLSFKARGLLALVLSNVGEWNCTLAWLVAQSESDGRVAVQAALNELTELGYRTTHQEHDRKGRLRTVVTWRHEPESTVTRPAENPTVGKPDERETRAPLEEHGLEHHVEEQQVVHLSSPLRDDVENLCTLLADLMEQNGCVRPTITKAWRDAARLMLDKDGRKYDDAVRLLHWCQDDDFWRPNIESMPKFRKQFDKLRLKAQQGHKPTNAEANRALLHKTAYNQGYDVPEIGGGSWT